MNTEPSLPARKKCLIRKQQLISEEDKRCGTCMFWQRGGIGAGKGGGFCLKWNIPKVASNLLMKSCYKPRKVLEAGAE